MEKEYVKTSNAPQPMGPYSQGIRVGNLLFVAGQGPTDPKTGRFAGSDIETQTRQTLNNVKSIVEAGGFSVRDIVKVMVFLKDSNDFKKMNEVYKTFFPENPPTRSTAEAKFVATDMLIEIEVIAAKTT
jgi:2-iminobutanoate/2-iminopropanoate deaminase